MPAKRQVALAYFKRCSKRDRFKIDPLRGVKESVGDEFCRSVYDERVSSAY